MAALTPVSEVKPFKTMWKVKVKIIRMWKQYSVAGGESIEIVFVDSNGDKIHGSVKKDLVGLFEPKLQQGQTYVLINFSLTHSCGSYRTTSHPYKIVFLPTTRVRLSDALPFNLSGLQPVKFGDINNGVLNSDYLVDVIGQIVEATSIEVVSVNGKDTPKISVELRNENNERLTLVLWGTFAEDMSDAVLMHSEKIVICVMRFGKLKTWKEDRSVSNAYNVSEVALNPNMEEVQAFMSLLSKDDLGLAIVDSKPLALSTGVSDKNDFFIHTPRKTISEVLKSTQVEKCVIMASVAAIDSDMEWYYLSCKVCAKKVLTVFTDYVDDGDEDDFFTPIYYCPKCKVNNPKLVPRYKLHLVVLDSTNNTKLLVFDTLALQLLQVPCIELTGPITTEIQEPDVLPPILNNLVWKTFLFKIGIERENFQYKHDTFKVLKIITNLETINEWDALDSQTVSENTFGGTFSDASDAPEGSLLLNDSSEQLSETNDMTPAKRCRAPNINLEESFEQSSVTRMACTIKVKKEKNEKSG